MLGNTIIQKVGKVSKNSAFLTRSDNSFHCFLLNLFFVFVLISALIALKIYTLYSVSSETITRCFNVVFHHCRKYLNLRNSNHLAKFTRSFKNTNKEEGERHAILISPIKKARVICTELRKTI